MAFSKESEWINKNNFFLFAKATLFKFKKEIIIVFLLMIAGIIFLT